MYSIQKTCTLSKILLMSTIFALLNRPSKGAPFLLRASTVSAFVSPAAKTRTHRAHSLFNNQNNKMIMMARNSSTAAASVETETTEAQQEQEQLLHPSQLFNATIPYPTSLSPSAVMEFKKCPQSYLFQYLYGLRQPTNTALALGSMCHEALEKVFDLDAQDRSLEHLQNLFRSSWAHHRTTKAYQDLFGTTEESTQPYNETSEREWGQAGLKLLENYIQVEDPRHVQRPNPIQREIWLRSDLSVDPSKGVTARNNNQGDMAVNHGVDSTANKNSTSDDDKTTFHVRGIVDRLDMVKVNGGEVALRIVDYKTGKAPHFKYSQAMNEHIAQEAFYQLKIYALLLRENGADKYANRRNMELRMLRLLYLTSVSERGEYLDYDLGATQEERDVVLQEVHQDLANVWNRIHELVATQDPKAFVGCDRSFCYCHKCRTQFVPGTVWEPQDEESG